MAEQSEKLQDVAKKLLIGEFQRHVFLCAGGKCASEEVGQEAWECLKKELKDRNLSLSTGPNACFRTKVSCLRLCQDGPIVVVYPEGTWYGGMTKERIPLFVTQHLIEGEPIKEWIFANNPLPSDEETTELLRPPV